MDSAPLTLHELPIAHVLWAIRHFARGHPGNYGLV